MYVLVANRHIVYLESLEEARSVMDALLANRTRARLFDAAE